MHIHIYNEGHFVSILRHEKCHQKIKEQNCDICNKEFSRKEHLLKHTKRSNLKRHIKTHIQSTAEHYSCDKCKKSFYRSDDLKKHIRTHEEPEFQCTHCKEYFSNTFNLTQHIEGNHRINFPGMGSIISDERWKHPKQSNVLTV